MHTIAREFSKAEKVNQKLMAEASELTFKPQVNKQSVTPRRINEKQANNFWERNLDFLNKKKEKVKNMDTRVNRNLTFKPEILPKSRDLSRSASNTSRTMTARPWVAARSASKGSLQVSSGILTARNNQRSKQDLLGVAGFNKFTRQSSREATN